MSYQAAGFNPNQTAIRSVQAQATGANDAAATAPVYQPYAMPKIYRPLKLSLKP
ncbi:MAG TPA: hypothetical protein PK856_05485 [Vitreoscilla sp.]|nr:hypothetical protein [Vitreoscilla sp.]